MSTAIEKTAKAEQSLTDLGKKADAARIGLKLAARFITDRKDKLDGLVEVKLRTANWANGGIQLQNALKGVIADNLDDLLKEALEALRAGQDAAEAEMAKEFAEREASGRPIKPGKPKNGGGAGATAGA